VSPLSPALNGCGYCRIRNIESGGSFPFSQPNSATVIYLVQCWKKQLVEQFIIDLAIDGNANFM
jgi:hypothetical protein